jgi:sugar phosphate isomerase/epimerase
MLPESAEHMARMMEELGLKKLQLGLVPHRDDVGILDGVPEALERVGARIVSGMFGTVGEDYSTMETIKVTGGIIPDAHWEANQEVARGAAARARRFGLSAVMFHAGFLPHDMDSVEFRKLADRIETMAAVFSAEALDLLFETGQETADDLWAFFDHMEGRGVSNIGINFDPANMILYNKGEPIEALRKLLPRVKSIHVKDAIRSTTLGQWGTDVPVGEGQVDWRAFIEVLAEGGYTGDMHIEREAGDERMADARKAIDVITAAMSEVG